MDDLARTAIKGWYLEALLPWLCRPMSLVTPPASSFHTDYACCLNWPGTGPKHAYDKPAKSISRSLQNVLVFFFLQWLNFDSTSGAKRGWLTLLGSSVLASALLTTAKGTENGQEFQVLARGR